MRDGRNAIPTMLRMRESTTAKKNPEDAVLVASSSFFAPSCLESMFPAPIPIVKPMACIMAMIEKTIPTAPDALVPSLETK